MSLRSLQSRQRMSEIDDRIERRPQQVLLSIVPRARHPCFSTPRIPRPENHDLPKTGIAKRKKAETKPRLPGKSYYSIATTCRLVSAASAGVIDLQPNFSLNDVAALFAEALYSFRAGGIVREQRRAWLAGAKCVVVCAEIA